VIARDEEGRIESCLRSAAAYADEMIVVDTGSTDRTREIAARCGARVFDFPWVDCFATARNQSLDQARGGWIFWMDADDVLPPESGELLRELVRRCPQRNAAYQAYVRIPPGPGEFSESLVDHVKLFPNRPDLRFEHRIHEQILPAIRRAGLEVLFSDLSVIHQNYDRSAEGQERKRERDFRLLELDLRDRPDHPFVLFNLGMTHLYATKEYEVAAHYLRRSLDRSDWRDSIVRKAYAMLTTARICQQEWEAALAANEEGRGHYPDDAELLFQAGQVYQQLNRFDDARRALERLVEGREDPHYRSVDTGLPTYRGRHELALLFRRMRSFDHSAQVLEEIAAGAPQYLPAQLDLVEALCLQGNRAEARRRLAAIPPLPELAEPLARLHGLLNGRMGGSAALRGGRLAA
jgi:glycosyltransferase involved in cell wall biosynthesis